MNNLSDIKRRIVSVKQTRKITNAMQTVSVSKLHKSIELYENSKAYLDELDAAMKSLMCNSSVASLFVPKEGKKLIMVLTSDRGLCGSFDDDIIKSANSVISEDDIVMPIGNFAYEYYKSRKNVDGKFVNSYIASYRIACEIAEYVLDMYGNGIMTVSMVFGSPVSRTVQEPCTVTVLPVPIEKDVSPTIDCFEPSASDVYETLLPLYFAGKIFRALAETNIAEHSARHAAMSTATESADKVINTLSVEYNQARQSAITEQIVEIIGSTAALNKQGNRL